MPRRTDIRKIMVIGSGPIVIGQACEFDYSGTQACKALRNEGFEVALINSNPSSLSPPPRSWRSWRRKGPTSCSPPSADRPG